VEWEVVSFRRGVSNVLNVGASPSLCNCNSFVTVFPLIYMTFVSILMAVFLGM